MVSDLLSRSLAEHERAKGLRRAKDYAGEKVALALARNHRLSALSEDPGQSDPSWAAEKVGGRKNAPHDELMSFYAERLR